MTISRRKETLLIELASFRSAFLADDSLVTIIPNFEYNHDIPLMSSATTVGPFQAGMPTQVPLWFARMLQQRSLCQVQVPEWLSQEHLTQVKRQETTQKSLTTDSTDNDTTTTTTATLPFYYAELGQRLTTSSQQQSQQQQAPVRLLLQDISQVRLDKLRQQFQQLTQETSTNPNICVTVPGIASNELAALQTIITQALNDQRFLATSAAENLKRKEKQQAANNHNTMESQEDTTQSQSQEANHNALRNRIRRLRR